MATRLIAPFLCLAAALLATDAQAAAWRATGQSGELRFIATQAGAKFTGRFRQFEVTLDLDPAAPAQGRLDVTVKADSADTADAERDAALKSDDFLAAGRFPEAAYHATGFRKDAKGYVADGQLTLRGVTKPVTVRFTLKRGAKGTTLAGGARLARLAFGVGQGDWADTQWIADAVDIAFDLRLQQAPAAASP